MLAGDVTVRLRVLPCGDLVVFLNIVQDIEKLPYCKIKMVCCPSTSVAIDLPIVTIHLREGRSPIKICNNSRPKNCQIKIFTDRSGPFSFRSSSRSRFTRLFTSAARIAPKKSSLGMLGA